MSSYLEELEELVARLKREEAETLLRESKEGYSLLTHDEYGSIGVRGVEGENWIMAGHLATILDYDPQCAMLESVKFTDVIMLSYGKLCINKQALEDIIAHNPDQYTLAVGEWLLYRVWGE